MAECESQKVVKPRVWVRNPTSTRSAVDAYDMADRQVSIEARKWFDQEIKPNATCPEGCEGPLNLRYYVKRIKVYGRRSKRNRRNYFIWILCKFTAEWDCQPEPPVVIGNGDDPGVNETETPVTTTGPTEPPPNNDPCVVDIVMTKNTATRSTPGVFDLTIDMEFEATRTNLTHNFGPGSTQVRTVEVSSSGSFGRLDRWMGRIKDVTGVLKIVNGAGDATITGTLRDTQKLPSGNKLRLIAGTRLRVTVSAIDDKGDTPPGGSKRFIIRPQ